MEQHDSKNRALLPQWGCWPVGCCLVVLFISGTVCALFYWLLWSDNAHAASLEPTVNSERPLTIWLLIDNSNSMFELGGIGSDPDLIRLDAARLFLSYLGIDEPGVAPQVGVIFFGSTAVTTVPLTPLTTDEQRTQLFAQIAVPPRMGWTDHLAALETAQTQLASLDGEQRPTIILLTDGKPEWEQTSTPAEQAAYRAALQAKSAELAEAGISLSIILLANAATAADTGIETVWQPLWQEMSAATPAGRFYVARTAAELPTIYHDLVVALTGRQTAGLVLDTAVTDRMEAPLRVPPGLAQMTLVISKSSPTQTVTIQTADAISLADGQPGVRQVGGQSHEEIWIIEEPQPGIWTVQLGGQGHISIWQDYRTEASPGATPTIRLSASPMPVATSPTPLLVAMVTTLPTATAVPPTILVTSAPAELHEEVIPTTPEGPEWPWLFVGGLLIVGIGTAVLFRNQQRANQPTVTGTLRLLGHNQTEEGFTVIDLDRLNKPRVVVGRPPADLPLPGALAQAIIRPGTAIAVETYEMRIQGQGEGQSELWLKGRPLTGEATLFDTVVIDFGGGVRVRYENLRLRRAERERLEMRN